MSKTKISPIRIDDLSQRPYLGIRNRTPFKGMFKQVDLLAKELDRWLEAQDISATGPSILRYHVIDMAGEMDISYGVPVDRVSENERVKADILPAGRYASLVYVGSGLKGNGALIDWARAEGVAWDRWQDARGDAFRSRYERHLTDPKIELRKTWWDIEVAIKLAD